MRGEAHPRYLRPGRPISVSAVPLGPGIDIWRSCRFIGAMMRSLCMLPGGLGRFVPCSIGANHCRLRHLGRERCSHGLTSRPRESASGPFLISICSFFTTLPGLLVRCLLVLFLYGIVLHGLLLEPVLGLCPFLAMLLGWLLLRFRLLRLVRLQLLDGVLILLVFLVWVGNGFGWTEAPSTPRGTLCACSSTCVEELAFFWVHWSLWC